MSALFFRRAFSDHQTLLELSRGHIPVFESWRRRIYLLEQRDIPGQPDHLLKRYRDKRFQQAQHGSDVQAFGDVVWTTLEALADRFIERRAGNLHVKAECFQEWHQLITQTSPLAIIVAYLVKEGRIENSTPDTLRKRLCEELGDTALLTPFDPTLQQLIEKDGLSELHLHLNGSTEMDLVWSDAVVSPKDFTTKLNDSGNAKDLFENIAPNWNAKQLYGVLRAARRLRFALWFVLIESERAVRSQPSLQVFLDLMKADWSDCDCKNLWHFVTQDGTEPNLNHPFAHFLSGHSRRGKNALHDEAFFLFSLLDGLRTRKIEGPAALAAFFLFSVQRQIIELSVQQTTQFGFEQFQKFADNEVRCRIEHTYGQRFRQLNIRPPYRLLRHLEGRFAPKNTLPKLETLLAQIIDGVEDFRNPKQNSTKRSHGQKLNRLRAQASPYLVGLGKNGMHGRPNFELSLVAHFIKRPKKPRDNLFLTRSRALRVEASTLTRAIKRRSTLNQLVRGIDAAANELDTPPEVFAPVYRFMRATGIPHATFHVGEDFRHILGGMRLIDEAVELLELGAGDRIGHATAIGISPSFWLACTPERIIQTQWESLQDLVFAHSSLQGEFSFVTEVQKIEKEIAKLTSRIFGRCVSAIELNLAFSLRHLDILEVEKGIDTWLTEPNFFESAAFWATNFHRKNENERIHKISTSDPYIFGLYLEIMRLKRDGFGFNDHELTCDLLPAKALTCLQSKAITKLNDKGIAIETLPTSNLRISHYCRFEQHHIFRWMGCSMVDELSSLPKVCLGSDDPGIFATNLQIEYALIADVLRHKFKKPETEVAKYIQELNDTSTAHRFAPMQHCKM